MFKSSNASPAPTRSSLTQNGLHSLLDQSTKGITIQIISAELLPEKQPGSQALKYKVVISDGCAKHKAVLGNKAALTFRAAGMPTFAVVVVRDLMQLNVTSPKRLIILTDIEIIKASLTGTIGYPIEYQEWQQQVQHYETIQKNHQSNSRPFYLDDNEHTGVLPPGEDIVPRAVIMENPMSFQETEISRQEPVKPNIIKQDSAAFNPEKFMYRPKPSSVEKDNNHKIIAKYTTNSNGNTQSQAKNMTPEKEHKPIVEHKSANLQQSLTTATETDSDSEIEIEKPVKTDLKKQNSISSLKSEKQSIVSERNIKKLIQFPVFGMNVRALEDSDCTQFHQAIGMDQAFSVDLLDKNGNKITAVFFGEQAENFLGQFRDHDTHIISNLTTKMSIEK